MFKTFALATGLTLAANAAMAATISIVTFDAAAYEANLPGSNVVREDFETYSEGNVANGFSTSVGTFSTIGGVGGGGTVNNASFPNDGSLLAIREGRVYGRSSTTPTLTGDTSASLFLDSNDTLGIVWDVSIGGSTFDQVMLTVTDAAEFGDTLYVSTPGATASFDGVTDGNSQLVTVSFADPVRTAQITFEYRLGPDRQNADGFSLDDIAVSAVPLPASSLLLLGALGGIAAMARRRKSA